MKAFKDGSVVAEFTGALPKARVEAWIDGLVPSEADLLVEDGDDESLQRAIELDPRRADARIALARRQIAAGDADAGRALLEPVEHDATAAGLLARLDLAGDPAAPEGARTALEALALGDHDQALDGLLAAVSDVPPETRDRSAGSWSGSSGSSARAIPASASTAAGSPAPSTSRASSPYGSAGSGSASPAGSANSGASSARERSPSLR